MTKEQRKTYDMVYIAVFTVLLALCSWISIPTVVPFTMQTFGIFMAVGILGGKRGTICVLVYLILGAIGLPVFSGMTGGFGILLGNRGGYIFGFLLSALVMWCMECIFGRKPQIQLLSMILGLIICYLCGTVWFMAFYTKAGEPMGVTAVLSWCVVPFIIPDLMKMILAFVLTRRIRKYVL